MDNPESHDRGDYSPLPPRTTTPEPKDDAPEHEHKEPQPPRRAGWRRLGTRHLLTLFLGSVTILLALIALGLLWTESIRATSGTEPRAPWVRVLRGNWATTIVTVCAAFIRAAMAFQASLATAMLAGIILETIGVPLFLGPLYSILRAVDITPNSLLSPAIFRSRGWFSYLICALIVIEVTVTIASQFLSTILVSDFAEGVFADMTNSTTIPNWEPSDNLVTNEKWWSVPSPSTWTFAEHSEEVTDGPTFHDTGPTYRAFLPFDSEAQRTSLSGFSGPALVMDQRVACARPSLSRLTYDTSRITKIDYLAGQLAMDPGSYPESRKEAGGEQEVRGPVNFRCGLGLVGSGLNGSMAEAETSLCILEQPLGNISFKDPLVEPSPRDVLLRTLETTAFILVDVISATAVPERMVNATGKTVRNDGPWAVVDDGSGREAVRVTSCITNLNTLPFGVDIRGPHQRAEPRMSWDSQAGSYSTEAVRYQLGASLAPESLQDRGILSLGPRPEWRRGDYTNRSRVLESFFDRSLSSSVPDPMEGGGVGPAGSIDRSILLSVYSQGWLRAHATHAAVFQDTLRDTESPALALQAVLARIHQMAYYSYLPLQNSTVEASTSFTTSALVPARWGGFIAATALIVTHFVIVIVVTALFLGSTRHSLVGNFWQAVSQVVSDQTLPLLEQVDGLDDKGVKGWAKSQSVDVNRLVTLRRRHDGQIALGSEDTPPAEGS